MGHHEIMIPLLAAALMAAALALRCHSLVNAGTTAEPLNQSDMPSSSAKASNRSVRQRDPVTPSVEECCCKLKAGDCSVKARCDCKLS